MLEDRKEFEIQVYRKNKKPLNLGYFIHLENWEDLSTKMSATRSQDEYNKKIKDCNIFILLGYSKIGKYTEEEFDVAYDLFKEEQSPQIHTFFKEIDHTKASLTDFKNKLNELKYFYGTYSSFESLWIQINVEIDQYIKNYNVDKSAKKEIDPNIILFNNYSIKTESYYVERSPDIIYVESLKIENVWIYGKSGSGKTTLINRNLLLNNIRYCYCDLSPVTM